MQTPAHGPKQGEYRKHRERIRIIWMVGWLVAEKYIISRTRKEVLVGWLVRMYLIVPGQEALFKGWSWPWHFSKVDHGPLIHADLLIMARCLIVDPLMMAH